MNLIIAENSSVARTISKSFGASKNIDEYSKGSNYIVTCLENMDTVISKEHISSLSVAVGTNNFFIIEPKIICLQNKIEINAALCKEWISNLRKIYIENHINKACEYFNKAENLIKLKKGYKNEFKNKEKTCCK